MNINNYLILLGLVFVLLFLTRKKTTSVRTGKRLVSGGSIFIVLLIAGVLYISWISIAKIIEEASRISFNLSVGIWVPLSVIAGLLIMFELIYLLGDSDVPEDKLSSWRKNWKKARPLAGFTITWTFVVFIVNIILWQIESPQWKALWAYKGVEWSPLFVVIMCLFILSMLLMVNIRISSIKLCGLAIFALAIYGWTDVLEKTLPAKGRLVIDKFLVPKGQVKGLRFDDIATGENGGMDDLPSTWYRVNRTGDWVERKFGKPWNLPRDTNWIEFKADQDFIIKVYKRI